MRNQPEEERRELEAAGWQLESSYTEKNVWRNPHSGYLYPQDVAIAMIREGADPGDVPQEPEGGA